MLYFTPIGNAKILKLVTLKWIHTRIDKSRARQTPNMERAIMPDEIEKKHSLIKMQNSNYRLLWSPARTILFFFDLLCFCRHVAKIDVVKEKENLSKNERKLCLHRTTRFWQLS